MIGSKKHNSNMDVTLGSLTFVGRGGEGQQGLELILPAKKTGCVPKRSPAPKKSPQDS